MNSLERTAQLLRENGYDEAAVDTFRRRIAAEAAPEIFCEAIEQFFSMGISRPYAAAGITTAALEQVMDMSYPSALATILWLRQEPAAALDALWYYSDGELGESND